MGATTRCPSPGAFLPGKQVAVRILFVVKPDDTVIEYLGLMYISAVAEAAGHECLGVAERDQGRLAATVAEFRPGIVGFSMTTGVHLFHLDLVRRLKQQFDFVSVFGGPHPTYFPEIAREQGVDVVCVGEGEYPLLELADHLQAGTDYRHIPNLIVKQSGELFSTPPRPFVQDLDALPFPNRGLFRLSSRSHYSVIANRGCPYSCTYCFNHQHKRLTDGRYLRQRSVTNVIAEARELRDRYGAKQIDFQDDIFILDKRWLREFAPRFREEVGLPFWCHVRANLVTEEVVGLLKEAGCVAAAMGVEAGDDKLRNQVLRRQMSREEIVRAGRWLIDYGIELLTQNMMALPGETIDMAFETVKINAAIRPQHMNLYFLQPYPGTELARYSAEIGCFDGDFSDYPESYLARSTNKIPIKTPQAREFKLLADIFHPLVKLPALIPYAQYALTRRRDTLGRRIWSSLLSLPIKVYSLVKVNVLRALTHEQRQAVRRLLKV
jgi:anaerobic magnesium-protoporphyrin IX monomethyl ester cyclase